MRVASCVTRVSSPRSLEAVVRHVHRVCTYRGHVLVPSHLPWRAGYSQPDKGQFGCINCDSLGDFYQESPAGTSCEACPANTRRDVGVLSAANRSSCQCKEGLHFS
jgi:hypothetical protein